MHIDFDRGIQASASIEAYTLRRRGDILLSPRSLHTSTGNADSVISAATCEQPFGVAMPKRRDPIPIDLE